MMKKIKVLMFLLIISICLLSLINCVDNNEDNKIDNTVEQEDGYIGQMQMWDNGVEFILNSASIEKSIKVGLSTYTTNNKFILVSLTINNTSNDVFKAKANDIWLIVNDAKINQLDVVYSIKDGYENISQSATTKKNYTAVFEVGENINLENICLKITNGKAFDNKHVSFVLQDPPESVEIKYNYVYNNIVKIKNYKAAVNTYLEFPYREGYTFIGWYKDSEYKSDMFVTSEMYKFKDDEKLEFYAKWEPKTLKIEFVPKKYYSDSVSIEAKVGDEIVLKNNIYSKEGFKFLGWVTELKSGEIFLEGDSFLVPDVDELKFYAKWEKDIFTVSDFNAINQDEYAIYNLMNDIDFANKELDSPMIFLGELNGNYHKISNLNSSLFDVNDGIIRDLYIENINLTDSDYSPHIYSNILKQNYNYSFMMNVYAGIIAPIAYNSGVIKNVIIDSQSTQSNCFFGGLVGVNVGSIENSVARVNNSSNVRNAGTVNIGGLCGYSLDGSIVNSYVSGNMNIKYDSNYTSINFGGIIGRLDNSNVANSYSEINIIIECKNENQNSQNNIGGCVGRAIDSSIKNLVIMGDINIISEELTLSVAVIAGNLKNIEVEKVYAEILLNKFVLSHGCFTEGEKFVDEDFYSTNNLFQIYINEETLTDNKNAVWVVENGRKPYLYFEEFFDNFI